MPRNHEGYTDIVSRINDMRRPGVEPVTSWIDVAKTRRGGDGTLEFENSWGNIGGQRPPAQFHLSEDGKVYLRGHVGGGAVGSIIFTLPEGYRPDYAHRFAVPASDDGKSYATIEVADNGEVRLIDFITGT